MDLEWREYVLSDVFVFMTEIGQRDRYSRQFLSQGQTLLENLQKMEAEFPGSYCDTVASMAAMVAYVADRIKEEEK